MINLEQETVDKNLMFIRAIDKWPRQQKVMARSQIGKKILRTFDMFEELSADEITEWFEIIFNKIETLLKKILELKANEQRERIKKFCLIFRQTIRALVMMSVGLNQNGKYPQSVFKYDQLNLEKMIKVFYYSQYQDEVLDYFYTADYDCSQFITLSYRSMMHRTRRNYDM